jgi:hypothetical protein
MKLIQDKLNDVGPMNFAEYIHDNASGVDSTHVQLKIERRVVADSGSCSVSYHHKLGADGLLGKEGNSWFLLNAVVDVALIPLAQEVNTASGHPTHDTKFDPPVFVLARNRQDIQRYLFLRSANGGSCGQRDGARGGAVRGRPQSRTPVSGCGGVASLWKHRVSF